MHVALATASDTAVAGPKIETYDHSASVALNPGDTYRCLLCGAELTYTGDTATGPFDYFTHPTGEECINDGNVSVPHRLGQELVVKRLVNWLPTSRRATWIDVERRVGTNSEFIIADVLVMEPVRIAVEIVYLNPNLSLSRRLPTLFRHGYGAMVVCLTTGSVSPARIQQELNRLSKIRIGRFNPDTHKLELGSLVTPSDINPDSDTSMWSQAPTTNQ